MGVVTFGLKKLFPAFLRARAERNTKRRGESVPPPQKGEPMKLFKSRGWTTHAASWGTVALGLVVLFGVAPEAIQQAISPGEATAMVTGGLIASRLRASQK